MGEALLIASAKELINILISNATPEIKIGLCIKGEVEKLKNTLGTIQGFLQTAETRPVGNQPDTDWLRDWLRRVKNVAYDIDDVLDKFAYEDLRHKMENQNSIISEVRDFFSPSNQIVFRIRMAHKIKKIINKLDEFRSDATLRAMLPVNPEPIPTKNKYGGVTTHDIDVSEVVGRKDDISKIINELTRSNNQEVISVIPILGMGGLGKTTLARLIFNDESIQRNFEPRKWVCIPGDFNVDRLLKEITEEDKSKDLLVTKLHEKLRGKPFFLVLDNVWNENNRLNQEWDEFKHYLKLGHASITVVVTTRSDEVARIMTTNYIHRLEKLSEDYCFSIFSRRAFSDGGPQRSTNLEEIARRIVKKSGGVPLAAKVLGGIRHSKMEEQDWLSIEQNGIWDLQEDKEILLALKLSFDNLPSHLKQCFAYCSIFPKGYTIDNQTLIQLWMAEGFLQQPKRGKLMEDVGDDNFKDLLWSSLFEVVKTNEYGDVISCKMHDLAMSVAEPDFSVVDTREVNIVCGVRGLSLVSNTDILVIPEDLNKAKNLRTFLLSTSSNGMFLKISNNMSLNVRSLRVLDLKRMGIKELPSSVGKLKHLRYLDLSYTKIKVLHEFITSLYNLQTLKLENCFELKGLPNELGKMINLRYLDLSGNLIEVLPESVTSLEKLQTLKLKRCRKLKGLPNELGKMTSLRYLDLSSNLIEVLPESIISLENLQTLKLEYCYNLKGFPNKFGNMKSMRHLVLDSGIHWDHMPINMGLLRCLQTLPLFVVGQDMGHGIKELRFLNLRGHLTISHLENASGTEAKEANLKGKHDIHSLRFIWGGGGTGNNNNNNGSNYNADDVLKALQPPSNLRSLMIECFDGGKLSTWLTNRSLLPNLVEIKLMNCNGCKYILMPGELPLLRVLEIFQMEKVERLDSKLYHGSSSSTSTEVTTVPAFPLLKKLTLIQMPNLVEWLQVLPSFPCLENLTIRTCPMLKIMPSLFPSLKNLSLRDVNYMALKLALSNLASLIWLEIKNGQGLTSLPLSHGLSLKELKLDDMPNLVKWLEEPSSFPCLEKLTISNCTKLKVMPSLLPSLKKVVFFEKQWHGTKVTVKKPKLSHPHRDY